jgi:hypothetical protein
MGSIRSPETVGDSINENTWQHLMFANSRPANLTIPELEKWQAAVSIIPPPPPTCLGATTTPSNRSFPGIAAHVRE